ncbi:MAG: hypothetical protein ACUVQ0_06245 [Thermoproteota archaeon]
MINLYAVLNSIALSSDGTLYAGSADHHRIKPIEASSGSQVHEFLVRAEIDSVSINPDAAVFTRKLVASVEQRITLEKALGEVKVDPH